MPSRRTFLRSASLLPLGAVSTACAALPAATSATLAGNVRQLKIAEVEAFVVPRAVYAKVTADDGTVGWGECGHSGGTHVARLVNRDIRELAVGQDVFDAEPVWRRIYHELDELGPGGIVSQALGGVDCALWDLRGKLLGVPVWALLGGKFRDRLPIYGSFSRDLGDGTYMTPTQIAERAEQLVLQGFKAIKVRLAIREENLDPMDDPALPAVEAARRAIGDDIELYVDANNGYSAARAIEVGRKLQERFNIKMFEEPCAAYHYAAFAQVAEALDVPIAAGEHEFTRWQFRDLILQGKVDILNPDLAKMGGITDGLRVSALAELLDLTIMVHNARPTLLTAAHLHYAAATMAARRPQEHPGTQRLSELWRFFENRIDVGDGFATVPDAPGLGLIVNEAAVRAAAS